jgi:ribosomal protein S17E
VSKWSRKKSKNTIKAMAGIITQKVKERPKDTQQLARSKERKEPVPLFDKKLSHPQPL